MTDAGNGGDYLRPADWPEVEVYTPIRIAEFLLNSSVSHQDYQAAIQEVINMGIDPATVSHDPF